MYEEIPRAEFPNENMSGASTSVSLSFFRNKGVTSTLSKGGWLRQTKYVGFCKGNFKHGSTVTKLFQFVPLKG